MQNEKCLITVNGDGVAFNISGVGGDAGQGIGSVSIIDSKINDVIIAVLTNGLPNSPNIVLDNTVFENVISPVLAEGVGTLLRGNTDLWAIGKRYNGSEGSTQIGPVEAPSRGEGLNGDDGKLSVRSRPQYEGRGTESFLVATTDGECKNDATGDQAFCINSFLRRALEEDKIAYFPAGVYAVGSTVNIPTGSIVQGSSWSQILGSGFYFSDMKSPKVMVQVGNKGDIGTMEINDMLFSVRGATAGAIMMEWNVAAVSQGAAAMWDSHFRVGGALGTDLDLSTCPKFTNKAECIAASMMFRVTPQANGYFENVWACCALQMKRRSGPSVFAKDSEQSNSLLLLYGNQDTCKSPSKLPHLHEFEADTFRDLCRGIEFNALEFHPLARRQAAPLNNLFTPRLTR